MRRHFLESKIEIADVSAGVYLSSLGLRYSGAIGIKRVWIGGFRHREASVRGKAHDSRLGNNQQVIAPRRQSNHLVFPQVVGTGEAGGLQPFSALLVLIAHRGHVSSRDWVSVCIDDMSGDAAQRSKFDGNV